MTEDRVLVSRILEGDRQAFRALIQQNERLVAHMIGRLIRQDEDREELCQDVFLKVYEKIGEFNFQSKLSTWIATIAYRQGINYLRKKKIAWSEIPDEESHASYFISDENPEKAVADEDMNELILKFVELLPPSLKTALTLYHIDGMNYLEIGEVTGMPEGTVKSYLFRARKMLKEQVEKYLSKEPT